VEKEVSSRDNPSAAATIRSLAYCREIGIIGEVSLGIINGVGKQP
jgi:hypothetical protein